ncbi:MAG: Phenylalanine-tRNA ligase beta subunit [Candidatus Collierbacteria bacterium GW2011_GWB1_44_6]|uniref:phenylalanine--tRNA ligase n=2 Tax=Candidatus Collieribacteriota TaxID=1752725 RepID=A0A0G1JP80_9BACT|nr:MAG: Phenylalanine-tRNA ligase beta subunit [Candidatus Collierbacteria bacterium GW2011_GWC2_43_12]KKT73366.1 MAG: Phenylalanine-tRNA ligase beta subunit [Candidatus Collierbacteria bacterium GW2011_GWB1_44_6]KKT83342.1 MAG: Phenylalanine-tRNA ligase beta subunit [Microgenomates group bacterium GW2011_GWC1_44_9]
MDIIITDSALRKFLDTTADAEVISKHVSLCGPTFDRIKKVPNDYIFEIEAITNRVDTACSLGVARETAAILTQFNLPAKLINDPYKDVPKFPDGFPIKFHFSIEENLVVRFVAISMENINVKPSPKDTQTLLEHTGQRSLNNCIDVTNEITLFYGLPCHVFDLDKLAAQKLIIRESNKGETITTLDEEKNKLPGGDIVIEDGSGRLVDLCGIMGGQVAEIDDHTKNILLIVPIYDPQKIRKTSLSLQKRTVAAQLYEKQPDPELCLPVISKAVQLLKERADGDISSDIYDYYPNQRAPKLISLDFNWLNRFVGIDIDKNNAITSLASLGFGGTIEKDHLICSVPSWRYHDINIKEDIAEEVARIYGYFRLPSILPCVNLPSESTNLLLSTENKIKNYLSAVGFHETYNSSLISLDMIEKNDLNPDTHLKLKNALSRDFEYLRSSLVPSGLENLKHNIGRTSDKFLTFEISNVYRRVSGQTLPSEISNLAIISTEDYRNTKGRLESLFEHLHLVDTAFLPGKNSPAFYDEKCTAEIHSQNTLVGHVGYIKPTVLRKYGFQPTLTVIELDLPKLTTKILPQSTFTPISEYPLVIEDLTINSKKLIGDIIEKIKNTTTLIKDVEYLNSYGTKHTFKVSFGSFEKNLEQNEVNNLKEIIQKQFTV